MLSRRMRGSFCRLLSLSLAFFLLSLLSGCSGAREDGPPQDSGRLNVVTTIFPYYDFLRQIGGDTLELTLVVPAGMDSHSFEPTPADIITIQNADILVCNGGEMEQWLSRVLDSFGDGPAPGRTITMMDYVDTVEEEIVEGMEAEEHDHSEDRHRHAAQFPLETLADERGEDSDKSKEGAEPDGHEIEIEYDEHIWTSPANAGRLTQVLCAVLQEERPEQAAYYQERTDAYVGKLEALDREFRGIVEQGNRSLLIFGDKFPLRYFFDEYGLSYRAAFTGCSSDTEPSAQTIAYLIDKVREEQIPVVYYLELSSHRVAEIIGEETGARPLLFHSCHNVTRRQFDEGVTYLELMEQNARNLREGLK